MSHSVASGAFDMQSVYRALVIDDTNSEGCYFVDRGGKKYLDLFSSFALGALGYNHPRLLEVARSDAFVRAAVNPTTSPFVPTEDWLSLVDRLTSRYAPPGMTRIFCVDAGGEAVDCALKAAFIRHGERRRQALGRPVNPLELSADELDNVVHNRSGSDAVVVSFVGGFHGRGLGPLSATHSKPIHKADMPCFAWPSVPFPGARFPLEKHLEDNRAREQKALAELDAVLDAHAGRVAAVLIEPIQGEGGDRHASPEFFRQVQAAARRAGAAFIIDEVQTGVAMTGRLWAHEHFELPEAPDMVVFGKKMQIAGFFCTDEYDIRQFGRMYQTRNGDRARAMIGLAILDAIDELGLLKHARDMGGRFLGGLGKLAEKYPSLLSEPRGRALFLAFDLPTSAQRDEFLRRCRERGVFASYTGTRSVRLRPHLVIQPEHVEEALAVFDDALGDMAP